MARVTQAKGNASVMMVGGMRTHLTQQRLARRKIAARSNYATANASVANRIVAMMDTRAHQGHVAAGVIAATSVLPEICIAHPTRVIAATQSVVQGTPPQVFAVQMTVLAHSGPPATAASSMKLLLSARPSPCES